VQGIKGMPLCQVLPNVMGNLQKLAKSKHLLSMPTSDTA
jgi:hypothetical protein